VFQLDVTQPPNAVGAAAGDDAKGTTLTSLASLADAASMAGAACIASATCNGAPEGQNSIEISA